MFEESWLLLSHEECRIPFNAPYSRGQEAHILFIALDNAYLFPRDKILNMNMTDYFTDASALLAFALMLYIVVSWGFGQRHTLPLPPGPKGLPILGNFLDMRAARECETLRTWRDTYGELFISG